MIYYVLEIWLICFFCGLPCLRREGARRREGFNIIFEEKEVLYCGYDS
jgi:hypothetical protein